LSCVSQKLLASFFFSKFEGSHCGDTGRFSGLLLLSEQISDGTRPDQHGGDDET
jgi:hypothetical protein